MAVNLFELNLGDYVVFRNQGYAEVIAIEIDEAVDEDDDCTHTLTFKGIEEAESFGYNGTFYPWQTRTNLLDITDIVPASIIERKLQEQKEAQDECPF